MDRHRVPNITVRVPVEWNADLEEAGKQYGSRHAALLCFIRQGLDALHRSKGS